MNPVQQLPNNFPETDSQRGLSVAEAQRRLKIVGPNEITSSHLKSRLEDLFKLLLDPMGLMLLGLATLYAVLGDRGDAITLLIAWIPVTSVDVVLNLRVKTALKSLQERLSPFAKVLRAGFIQDLPNRELVPGDILIFEEGQSLSVDGQVLDAQNLSFNESALTGESTPVDKSNKQEFLSGTEVLTGRGIGLVETARATRFGQIAVMVETTHAPRSPLKKKVDHLVKNILIAAVLLAVFLFVLEVFRTGSVLTSLIIALTFGMAAVPEEFPLVFTLYLSLRAWRLAKQRVLVKSLPSVETLGSADILCTDKTGTLTEGRFKLEQIYRIGGEDEQTVWESALMACEILPVDAMETEIYSRGKNYVQNLKNWSLVWDYPFETHGKHMTHVWKDNNRSEFRTVMKGAIEGLLEHCQPSEEERKKIDYAVKTYAAEGKRILGLAMREGSGTGNRIEDERGVRLIGIFIFSDPIRSSVKQAIAECQAAGIEIKMLTGDHPLTSHFVADQIGIRHSHQLLFTGDDLEKMSLTDRTAAYIKGAIFSRVQPKQKFEMVQTLQNAGHIVAMTGDGINDAPALKLADIGISMGKNATDIARSAAQIVLLDSDFSGIVAAILEGRRILSNLRRSFSYLISFHIPVVLLALIPPLLGWTALLLPIHIILLELVVHPVSAFTFENLAAQSGRLVKSGELIGRKKMLRALVSGILVSLGALVSYRYLLLQGLPVDEARSCAFSAVLIGNIAFIVNEVTPQFNARFVVTVSLLILFVTLISGTPLVSLHLSPLGFREIGIAIGAGLLGLLPNLIPASAARLRTREI